MFQDGANRRLRQRESVVMVEYPLKRDCLRNRTSRRQTSQAYQHAQRGLGPLTHVQPIDDHDRNGRTGQIGESVQAEPDVAGQVSDARAEALCSACLLELRMPDRAHGPALDDEEEDLGCVAEAGEGEEGPEEDFEGDGAHVADDAEDCEADGDFDEADAEDVEDLAEGGSV